MQTNISKLIILTITQILDDVIAKQNVLMCVCRFYLGDSLQVVRVEVEPTTSKSWDERDDH